MSVTEPYKPGLAKQGISSDRLSFGKAVFLKGDGGVKPIEYMVCASRIYGATRETQEGRKEENKTDKRNIKENKEERK